MKMRMNEEELKELLSKSEEEILKEHGLSKLQLTPSFFAELAINRYVQKKNDTFIIIYGRPRTGKSTLALQITRWYLKFSRRLHAVLPELFPFEPPRYWDKVFKEFFPLSLTDTIKKIKKNPPCSPIIFDEALDFLSWHQIMTKEQQSLVELFMKCGEKGMLTILVTPSFSLLTKDILARAHYLIIIPFEFHMLAKSNKAYVLQNYQNPILAEKNPFSFNSILKLIQKNPTVLGNIHVFIQRIVSLPTFAGSFSFRFMPLKIYELYRKLVKIPLIEAERKRKGIVPRSTFERLKYMFDTVLFNLYFKDGKSYAQIENLLTDKFGRTLLNRQSIAKYIKKMEQLEVKPVLDEEDEKLLKKEFLGEESEIAEVSESEKIEIEEES